MDSESDYAELHASAKIIAAAESRMFDKFSRTVAVFRWLYGIVLFIVVITASVVGIWWALKTDIKELRADFGRAYSRQQILWKSEFGQEMPP